MFDNLETLQSPVAYQGGKQRIAKQVVDIMKIDSSTVFYDICCGSGAISIELINKGHPVDKIHMVDAGPWGLFWKCVGDGTFDIAKFETICKSVPKEPANIHDYILSLSKQKAEIDTVYVFILLQASSFGSKAIWMNNNKWMNCSFRRYWLPTETSNRRSPVNPMMPMPMTLLERVRVITERMKGIKGYMQDAATVSIDPSAVVYVDPPYAGTTMYGFGFDVEKFAASIQNKVFISEGRPLSKNAHLIEGQRKKGGISGTRKSANEEWISEYERH